MSERPYGAGPGLTDGRVDQLVLEHFDRPPSDRAASHLYSDPQRTAGGHLGRLAVAFVAGRIIQALPHLNWYRVNLGVAGGIVACNYLGEAAMPLTGRSLDLLPPESRVLVAKPPFSPVGWIVGVIPPDIVENDVYRPGWVWQGGQSGFWRDDAHKALMRLGKDSGVRDFSAGAPLDQTAFDRGWAFPTGVMLQLDPFMAQLRVSEFAGLLVTTWDQYVRLGGWNFDYQTAVDDASVRLDRGELRGWRGKCVYWHESLGQANPGSGLGAETSTDDAVKKSLEAGWDLPKAGRDAAPLFRRVDFDGYEGQGRSSFVLVPRSDAEGRLGHEGRYDAVYSESVGLDGFLHVASAKGMALRKVSVIPAPELKHRPEDKSGDGDGYRFAGQFGEGPQHFLDDPSSKVSSGPGLLSLLDDILAYAASWRAQHPFHYHKLDYGLEQPSQSPLGPSQDKLSFSAAADGQPLTYPQPKTLKIDSRYMRANYYSRSSGFVLADDGSSIWYDGYGNRIAMGPEGVRIESPVRVTVWSAGDLVHVGRQVILKAHDSVDITSANKDVRLYAKHNLHAQGEGVLIESTSTNRGHQYRDKVGEQVQSSGVTLRSKTEVNLLGDDLYLRSAVGDSEKGDIVLDGGDRENNIVFQADTVQGFLGQRFVLFRVAEGQEPEESIVLGGETALIDSNLVIGGSVELPRSESELVINGDIAAQGNILCTGEMADSSGTVGVVPDRVKSELAEAFAEATQNLDDFKAQGQTADRQTWEEGWHADDVIGSDDVIRDLAFSFRDDDDGRQYRVASLEMAEPRFAALDRLGGASGLNDWNEDPLSYQGKDLYPWPGRRALKETQPLVRRPSDEGLYDFANGIDQDRGDRYEQLQMPDPERVAFERGLRVLS